MSPVGGPVPGGLVVGTCGCRYQEGDGSTASAPMCQCGMFAIGACSECRAFTCGVHGDLWEGRFLCHSCKDRLRAEAREAASLAVAREAASYPRGRAAGALEAAGIPTVKIFAVEWNIHHSRWSGNRKATPTVYSWATGWIIGELNWRYHEEPSDRLVERPRLTALLDLRTGNPSGRPARWIQNNNLVMVSQELADGTYHVQQSTYFPGPYSVVDDAIRQLTGQ
jgi:hypothetical protein